MLISIWRLTSYKRINLTANSKELSETLKQDLDALKNTSQTENRQYHTDVWKKRLTGLISNYRPQRVA